MNDSNSSWDGFFSQVRQLHQHVLEIAVFFRWTDRTGPFAHWQRSHSYAPASAAARHFPFSVSGWFLPMRPLRQRNMWFSMREGRLFCFQSQLPASKKGRRGIWRYKVKDQMSSKSMRTVPEYRSHTGPPGFAEKPVCSTYRQGRLNAGVIFACPVGSGYPCFSISSSQASRSSTPA